MVSKLAAAVIILGVTLFSNPLHAESESPNPSVPQAATMDTGTAAAPDLKLSSTGKNTTGDVDKLNMRYAKAALSDTGKIMISPLRWDGKDWVTAGLVVGSTAALFLVDDEVNDFAQKNQSWAASRFADVGNFVGSPLYGAAGLGAFYLYGHLSDNSRARKASLMAFESFAISGILTSTIKVLASRHRPNENDGANTWHGPSLSADYVSFCSGHTSSAFSMATVFADVYKDNKYVPTIAYGLATLTGLSRVYSNEHWASDVVFGAALGYFTGKAILRYNQAREDKANRLTIMPAVGEKMTGLSLKYEF